MSRPSPLFISRRRLIAGSFALAVFGDVIADEGAPQLARRSGFPQMPTGYVGVTPCGSLTAPAAVSSDSRIAPENEPGEPLMIDGTVYREDRRTPASGITILAYHTDKSGHYNSPNSPYNPRLFGWARTDDSGRYRFRTIKPAPYPELGTPAHIHVSLYGPGYPEYWVDDYWFAGDSLITPHQRSLLTGRGGGGETLVLSPEAQGVLHGTRDFVLQRVAVSGNCQMLK
jgi:protocatechuate 3,4-dioxygenase beta subunit